MPELRRLAAGALALLLLAASGQAAPSPEVRELIGKAREAVARGDGLGAEVLLRRARDRGAGEGDVASLLGQAFLLRGDTRKAREWLVRPDFAQADAASGARALGVLEHREGRLPEAGRAFDRALAATPRDAGLWVDIARLRYAGGEHAKAIAAVDHALSLDPAHPRALEAKAQLVRDQFGLAPSLRWFAAGLAAAPDDLSLLADHAATLGDLGEGGAMLRATRRLLELDPRNPRAFYLLAVLAMRAGDPSLARAMLNRTRGRLAREPAVKLLDALILIEAGNPKLAVEVLDGLLRRQPGNIRVQTLLGRAAEVSGDDRFLIERLSGPALAPGAPPALPLAVGRAWERLGDREKAAPFLDRAMQGRQAFVAPVLQGSDLGAVIASGGADRAVAQTQSALKATPGSAAAEALAGDALLAAGQPLEAERLYASAAQIRMPEGLFLRRIEALSQAGRGGEAYALAQAFLSGNPHSRPAARLLAGLAAQAGQWARARDILNHLVRTGGARDPLLLADLSLARLRAGDGAGARAAAHQAWQVQPASPAVAQAWALALSRQGRQRTAEALASRAQAGLGDTPLLAEVRKP